MINSRDMTTISTIVINEENFVIRPSLHPLAARGHTPVPYSPLLLILPVTNINTKGFSLAFPFWSQSQRDRDVSATDNHQQFPLQASSATLCNELFLLVPSYLHTYCTQ